MHKKSIECTYKVYTYAAKFVLTFNYLFKTNLYQPTISLKIIQRFCIKKPSKVDMPTNQ